MNMRTPYCRICGECNGKKTYSSYDRLYGFPGEFTVFICSRCSIGWTEPQLKGKKLKTYYPSSSYYSYANNRKKSMTGRIRDYSISHQRDRNIFSKILSFIIKVPAIPAFHTKGKILDIGCGSGDTLALLSGLGWEVYGVDIDKNAIRVAHERGLSHVMLGSYRDIASYKDNFFDCIRMYHVIEHLDDPKKCLALIYKKLKPGGSVIVGTANRESFVAKLFGPYWYNLDLPRHLFHFSPKTLSLIVGKVGFKDMKISFCSGGGILGSIEHYLAAKTGIHIDLIRNTVFFLFVYPFEWFLDKIGSGDLFILEASKPL